MANDYMGSTDSQRLNWLNTFSAGVNANLATYFLSAVDGTTISGAVALFAAKYAVAIDPATRTKVAVQEKDEARNDATAICRQYAQQIKMNAGISDPDKIAVGIPPINETRTPRNVPDSSPLVNCLGATPGSHTLRYADSATPDRPAKPFGAQNIQIWVAIKETATVNEDEAQFYGAFTRNPISVGFAPEDDGKMATYFARWAGGDGQVGPWSLPVSMRIAA
jgi:hypothetical protein